MSEKFSIEIQADKSGVEEALNQVQKSLDVGKESAEALSHALNGDLSGAFKSLDELGKTLGITLDLAFSPLEILSFVKVVADFGEKLSTLISDTFIYTDAQKAEDKAIKESNDTLVKAIARVKELGRETQITAEKTAAGQEKLKLQFKLEDLGGDPDKIKAQLKQLEDEYNTAAAIVNSTKPAFAMHNEISDAQAKMKQLANTRTALTAALIQAQAEVKKSGQAIGQDEANQANAVSQAEIAGTLKTKEALLALQREKWNELKPLVKTSVAENEQMENGFEKPLLPPDTSPGTTAETGACEKGSGQQCRPDRNYQKRDRSSCD